MDRSRKPGSEHGDWLRELPLFVRYAIAITVTGLVIASAYVVMALVWQR